MTGIIMGVDFGDVRTGLAICDPSGFLATGAGCVKAGGFRKTVTAVAEAARDRGAVRIIVGNPKNMNNSEGPRSLKCRDFAAALEEESGIPVELYDERLTTVSAHYYLSASDVSGKKRKASVDELSATIILQDWLDSQKNK